VAGAFVLVPVLILAGWLQLLRRDKLLVFSGLRGLKLDSPKWTLPLAGDM